MSCVVSAPREVFHALICPDEVGPPFASTCDDIPIEWVEITSIHDDLVPTGESELQFRLFANRFKSSSSDCEYFLHDPLRHMLLKPGALKGLPWWPDESSIVDPGESGRGHSWPAE